MKAGKIVLDISMDEFKNYSEKTLSNMGLRTLRMNFHRDVKSAPGNVEKMILRDFSFSYEKEDAIIIPEISLQEGAVIAVIGKNGAGKSTFSRCLCGLEKKFKGKMIVGDKILQRKQLLKQCYMVMQDVNHQLFCESVKEEVQLGMADENCQNVPDVLKSLDLEGLTERHPMSLSGRHHQHYAYGKF